MKALICILPMTVLLVGCASAFNPVGDSTFDCNRKQNPDSPYCNSFKAVDAGTTGPLPASRFDKAFDMQQSDQLNGIAPVDQAPTSRTTGKAGHKTALLPHQTDGLLPTIAGQPVRIGPVIQRVVIKRWVDDSDSLHEGVVVYREVKPGHWSGVANTSPDNPAGRAGRYPHAVSDTTPLTAQASAMSVSAPPNDNAAPASATQFVPPSDSASLPQ